MGSEQCFSTTVKGIEMNYLVLDQKKAEAVRELQEKLGFSNNIDFVNAI